MKIRSMIASVTALGIFPIAIISYWYVPRPLYLWLQVGLAIVATLIISTLGPQERLFRMRLVVVVYGMFVSTAIYLSYLHREVVVASVIMTVFVTAVMYLRAVREIWRRERY